MFSNFKNTILSYFDNSEVAEKRLHDDACSKLFYDIHQLSSNGSVHSTFPNIQLNSFNFMKCVQYDVLVSSSSNVKSIQFNPSQINIIYPTSYTVSSIDGHLSFDFQN